ncbi:MAG: flagellar hook assembly protein FlgD [Myxococcaceae bacterium]|nr:flagellar hook assembly protein FlgD [Myxococcaceae bacterium]
MDVNAIATPVSRVSEEPQPSRLGKDEFLKLLMTQLGNQDPLSPMDNQAFVTQLAQFAQVEQAQQTSQRLDALLMAQASANQLHAASLVGKDAVLEHGDFAWKGEPDGVLLRGDLGREAAQVTAVVQDANGNVVRRALLGAKGAGPFEFTWDGKNDRGEPVSPGDYAVSFTAADAKGEAIDARALTRGRITGVGFETGYAELILSNHQRVKLADVLRIAEAG